MNTLPFSLFLMIKENNHKIKLDFATINWISMTINWIKNDQNGQKLSNLLYNF